MTPGGTCSLGELAERVSALAGGVEVRVGQSGRGPDYYGNGKKLARALPAWRPTTMEDGVELLLQWYADHAAELDRSLLVVDR